MPEYLAEECDESVVGSLGSDAGSEDGGALLDPVEELLFSGASFGTLITAWASCAIGWDATLPLIVGAGHRLIGPTG